MRCFPHVVALVLLLVPRVAFGQACPTTPRGFQATVDGSRVVLSWDNATDCPVNGYELVVGSTAGADDLARFRLPLVRRFDATAGNGRYFVQLYAWTQTAQSQTPATLVIDVGTECLDVGPPEAVTAVPDLLGARGSHTISWSAPLSGCSPAYYEVQLETGGTVVRTLQTAGTQLGTGPLPPGDYTAHVYAIAPLVRSPAADVTFVVSTGTTTPVVPGAPTDLAATVSGRTVVISWTAPFLSTVRAYRLTFGVSFGIGEQSFLFPNDLSGTLTLTATASGTYVMKLQALNEAGVGNYSNTIVVVIP